jgi:hypothetical protein
VKNVIGNNLEEKTKKKLSREIMNTTSKIEKKLNHKEKSIV